MNLSFLLILNSNDKYLSTLPYPIPDQFGQNLYRPTVFGPVWRKNRTLWGSKYDMGGFAKGTHFVHFQKDMSVGFEIFRMHQSVSSGLY